MPIQGAEISLLNNPRRQEAHFGRNRHGVLTVNDLIGNDLEELTESAPPAVELTPNLRHSLSE